MKTKVIISAILVLVSMLLNSCETNKENHNNNNQPQQLNISVLLDLSDRIDINKHPEQVEKDIAIISEIVDYFKRDMERRGTFDAKGKLQIFMKPFPQIKDINDLQGKLIVDCAGMDIKHKKSLYDSISSIFNKTLQQIYLETNNQGSWTGSDIWRFFQSDVKDYCVEQDTNYRNILIILTDGYIYDQSTTEQHGNRVQNLTSINFRRYLNATDPIAAIENDDFGLITPRNDLNNLEVLVLELNPNNNDQKHEQILKHCIGKWLKEMGVVKYAVYKTDLPVNTSKRIASFLK